MDAHFRSFARLVVPRLAVRAELGAYHRIGMSGQRQEGTAVRGIENPRGLVFASSDQPRAIGAPGAVARAAQGSAVHLAEHERQEGQRAGRVRDLVEQALTERGRIEEQDALRGRTFDGFAQLRPAHRRNQEALRAVGGVQQLLRNSVSGKIQDQAVAGEKLRRQHLKKLAQGRQRGLGIADETKLIAIQVAQHRANGLDIAHRVTERRDVMLIGIDADQHCELATGFR